MSSPATAAVGRRLIQLSPDAESVTVDPGGQASVRLTVYNPSSIVENFRLEVLGNACSWATLSPDEVNLFPDSTAEVTLTFHPSDDAPPEAGAVPFAVKATPQHEPFNCETEEGTVIVAALPRIAVPELVPVNSRGRRRGRHELLIRNTGNLAIPVLVSGADPDGFLNFAMRRSQFVLGYKEARLLRLRAQAPRYMVTGSNRQHRFALTVSADGTPDVKIPASFTQRPLLSRRLLTVLAALAGLALLGYFLFRPVLKATAQEGNTPTTSRSPQGGIPRPADQPVATPTSGPRGAAGAAGAAGAIGPKGASGVRGLTGSRGLSGAIGPRGPQGSVGPIGPPGSKGAAGPEGPPGATGGQGPAGITNGYQQALTGGDITFSKPTVIVKTPQLPAGHYAVLASLSVSNEEESGGSAFCWTTPDSAGIDNTDSVQAKASLSQQQELSINDIWNVTKAQDRIDLVCDSPASAAATNATLTVFPLTHATQTTVTGSTAQ
jgi:Collagen triple helix repeat (20 copies)